MVARALGLLAAIEPCLHEGTLTVFDPSVTTGADEDREVDLTFEGLVKPPSVSRAA